MRLSQIDFSKVPRPILIETIKKQIASGVDDFQQIKSTQPSTVNKPNFHVVTDTFKVDRNIETVFNHYISSNPSQSWDGGDLVAFGLAIDKNNGKVYYPNQDYPGLKVGQVFYIYMNLLGLKKIGVGQEIIKTDLHTHTIIFSYIEGGLSQGMQEIIFSPVSNTETRIDHTSYYKGKSWFRDKYLYPYFHSLVVKKFHENLKKSLK